MCVCVCVCPDANNFITTSYFAFTWGGWTHLSMSICPFGPGCLSGAFCPFSGLRSTPYHFQALPGHTDKNAYPCPPPTHTPPSWRRRAVRSSLELILIHVSVSRQSTPGVLLPAVSLVVNSIKLSRPRTLAHCGLDFLALQKCIYLLG